MTGVIHRPPEGPRPQRGSIPADPTALAREQASSQALMPQDGWRCSPLTTAGDDGKAGIRRIDASLRDIIIKEGPEPDDCGALPPATGSPHPFNKKAASSILAKMASLVKTLLAGSLLAFASVHAGVASHRGDARGSSLRARSGPVVAVKNGSYEGVYSSDYDQDFFLGMRYSQVRATSGTLNCGCCYSCLNPLADEPRLDTHSQQNASPSHGP